MTNYIVLYDTVYSACSCGLFKEATKLQQEGDVWEDTSRYHAYESNTWPRIPSETVLMMFRQSLKKSRRFRGGDDKEDRSDGVL